MGQLTKDEVFALAVQRYSDTVFRAAMHNCSCAADAEDVVQDVFEKLLRYEGRFESEEHLKACGSPSIAAGISPGPRARRTPNWTKTFLPRNPEMTAVCSMRCALCRKTTATPCTSIITRATPPLR